MIEQRWRRLPAAALIPFVVACFGDPPPAAEDLPLEIVVHPDECLLNYHQVGPGNHEVTVIYEGAHGPVSIAAGAREVFSDDRDRGVVDLEVGDYLVTCRVDGRSMEISLAVREGLRPGGG